MATDHTSSANALHLPTTKGVSRAGNLLPSAADNDMEHLHGFFAHYPDFQYRRGESIVVAYKRLMRQESWRGDDFRDEIRQRYQDALTQAFNVLFGMDVNSIESWTALCNTIGIEPPDTLRKCREAVENAYVNLVDLVDLAVRDTGERVEQFGSEEQLSIYTREEGKFFPKENAYAGGLLRYLLRHIMNPSASGSRRSARGNGRRGRGRGRGRGSRGAVRGTQ